MNSLPLVMSLILLTPGAPPVAAPDAEAIQRALNQGVELDSPDCQAVADLKILAGGKTASGEFLFVCEGDIVWSVSLAEFIASLQQAAKRQGAVGETFSAYAPTAISQQLPQFKTGDLITRARIRIRLERAGDDWIATSTKINKFDPEFTINQGSPATTTYYRK